MAGWCCRISGPNTFPEQHDEIRPLAQRYCQIIIFLCFFRFRTFPCQSSVFLYLPFCRYRFLRFPARTGDGNQGHAKWLAITPLPAWIFVVLSFWRPVFWRVSVILAAIAYTLTVLLALVNFGFHGFYGTPISQIIFGLFQDDTFAMVNTLLEDRPVLRYACAQVLLAGVPFAGGYMIHIGERRIAGLKTYILLSVSGRADDGSHQGQFGYVSVAEAGLFCFTICFHQCDGPGRSRFPV